MGGRRVVLGFSGTIASGKSARCSHLIKLAQSRAQQRVNQFAVYSVNADRIGHEVYFPGTPTYYKVLETFGPENVLMPPDESRAARVMALRERELERQRLGRGVVLHLLEEESLLGSSFSVEQQRTLLQTWQSSASAAAGVSASDVLRVAPPKGPECCLIDRRKLGSIVFRDGGARLPELNRIVWPAMEEAVHDIVERCTERIDVDSAVTLTLVVFEAALMVESGFLRFCDDLWLTSCSPEEAIRRSVARDGLTEEEARSRIMTQQPIEKKLQFIRDIHFRGDVRHFDTTSVSSLAEGLREVTLAFNNYWKTVLLHRRDA